MAHRRPHLRTALSAVEPRRSNALRQAGVGAAKAGPERSFSWTAKPPVVARLQPGVAGGGRPVDAATRATSASPRHARPAGESSGDNGAFVASLQAQVEHLSVVSQRSKLDVMRLQEEVERLKALVPRRPPRGDDLMVSGTHVEHRPQTPSNAPQVARLKQELNAALAQVAALKAELARASTNRRDADANRSILQQEVEKLGRKLQAAQEDAAAASQDAVELRALLATSEADTAGLRDEVGRVTAAKASAEGEADAAHEKALELSAELSAAQAALEEPCEACEMAAVELAASRAENDSLMAELKSLTLDLKDAEAAREAAVAAERREREDRHASMTVTIHGLRQEVAALQSQLASRDDGDLADLLAEVVEPSSTWKRKTTIRNAF